MRILQRGEQPVSGITRQAPREVRNNKYFWNNGYERPNYRNGYEMGYEHENKDWGQRNDYGRRYGNGNKGRQGKTYGRSTTQTHTYYTTHGKGAFYKSAPSKRIGGGQEGNNGNGRDKNDGNRKRYKDARFDFRDESEEESDTEDSFELEITPQ